ncbi:MAG: hypothetical protein K6B14_09790, partial [Lachnospiraceae bacterium]|nr:hypothetical protein [Lachnospiraceae bacterium]
DGRMFRANEMEGVETFTMAELLDYCEFNGLTMHMSPQAISQLNKLQVFDLICGQVDRHLNNYNVIIDDSVPGEVTVTGIKAIDNDMSFGGLKYEDIRYSTSAMLSFMSRIEENGSITIPYLEKGFYEQLLRLEENNWEGLEKIALEQSDIRTPDEIDALKDRIKGVVDDLKTQVQYQMITLVETEEEWEGAYADMLNTCRYGRLKEGYAAIVFSLMSK